MVNKIDLKNNEQSLKYTSNKLIDKKTELIRNNDNFYLKKYNINYPKRNIENNEKENYINSYNPFNIHEISSKTNLLIPSNIEQSMLNEKEIESIWKNLNESKNIRDEKFNDYLINVNKSSEFEYNKTILNRNEYNFLKRNSKNMENPCSFSSNIDNKEMGIYLYENGMNNFFKNKKSKIENFDEKYYLNYDIKNDLKFSYENQNDTNKKYFLNDDSTNTKDTDCDSTSQYMNKNDSYLDNLDEYKNYANYISSLYYSKSNHINRVFNLLKFMLAFLPFSLNKYIIGTLKLKEIIDNENNNCCQLYTKSSLMKYIYENESKNLVDNKVYNIFNEYNIKKKGTNKNLNIFNFQQNSDNPSLEEVLIEKSRILIYKVHSFIEGRLKNLSYIYEICYGLSLRTETFILAVFIFDYYLHKINEITEKNHYRKVKLIVIISSILLALIKTENSVPGEKMFLSDIISFLNERLNEIFNYTCIEIANKQMEILKTLPNNYCNYWSFNEITYIYLINLKSSGEKNYALKTYYKFLEDFGLLYFLYEIIYEYSMYIIAVGSYKLIPPSRIVASIILFFSNAFFNNMSNNYNFLEMFCQEVFHLSFVNDLYMWSYLFLDNFLVYFESCEMEQESQHYLPIYQIFYKTGKLMGI